MPTIEITDHDFARLQKVAVPFIDTPATVFTKILDVFERSNAPAGATETPLREQSALRVYHHDNLPPLTHTKLLEARFGDLQPERDTWDALVRLALIEVKGRVGTLQDLRRISAANVVEGRKEDEGYKFLPGHGFSYQGVSAEDAVKIVFRCAKGLKVDFAAEFEWRSKDEAYLPGERARLEYRVR
ncbi:MAG: T4SS efffector SepA family protein [Pikeienuella sp.]|uniref:T4SS efffector SepA family protein n=1 Tax=Pikeienuella sp. TaxID=2831957 RepID=UPI00391C7A00